MQLDDKPTCREYGARGHGKRRAEGAYCIEGEYVTPQQMSDRLGVHRNKIYDALDKAKKDPDPVTWDKIREYAR